MCTRIRFVASMIASFVSLTLKAGVFPGVKQAA